MKILVVHNYYKKVGGEDNVFQSEITLLRDCGQDVQIYERSNSELDQLNILGKMKRIGEMKFSKQSYRELRSKIRSFKPSVVHFHNTFFMMTPSVYYACKDENVPVVQSQHNFRLACCNALLYRNNQTCELCIKKGLLNGIVHKCYHNSYILSALVTNMIHYHRKKRTWHEQIDTFIVASHIGRSKLVEIGIPQNRIVVKPNLLYPEPSGSTDDRGYALYVGRLSQEKGVDVILNAWKSLPQIPLKIMGCGPKEKEYQEYIKNHNLQNIEMLGFVQQEEYEQHIRGAQYIIIPSRCYENFPLIVAEGYAYSKPIIGSRLGSLIELIEENETGLMFEASNPSDLAEKVTWMKEHKEDVQRMGRNAREKYVQDFSAQKNYDILMEAYDKALMHHSNTRKVFN